MLNSIGLYPSSSRPGTLHPPVPHNNYVKVPDYKIISLDTAESPILKNEDNSNNSFYTVFKEIDLSYCLSVLNSMGCCHRLG